MQHFVIRKKVDLSLCINKMKAGYYIFIQKSLQQICQVQKICSRPNENVMI
jgi:hypothetical protein